MRRHASKDLDLRSVESCHRAYLTARCGDKVVVMMRMPLNADGDVRGKNLEDSQTQQLEYSIFTLS